MILAPLVFSLAACESPARLVVEPDEPPAVTFQPAPLVSPDPEAQERERRYIADILYEGMRALREDRLMTPAENSAYRYFSRVLALEPENVVALDGMQDIVQRYLQLADTASRQGQFANAETFLRRAAQVNPEHPGIDGAYRSLEVERERTHSVHVLNSRQLRNGDAALVQELSELAQTVAQLDAFALITAPNDELGRWIYAQLQGGIENYRIRSNIEIGAQPTVRLVVTPSR